MINQRMIDAWAKVEETLRANYAGPAPLDGLEGVELIARAARVGAVNGPAFTLANQLLQHADDLDTVPDEFVGRCETLCHLLENPQAQQGMINVQQHVEMLRRSGQY